MTSPVEVVATRAAYGELAELVGEYVASLPFALTFQDLEREIAEIDREYGPPHGCAWIVRDPAGAAAGAAGIRRFDDRTAELKRMYVRPAFRGRGYGVALASAAVEQARRMGYERIVLDSVASMRGAIAIYRSIGFVDAEPYRHNPQPDPVFMELRLRDAP